MNRQIAAALLGAALLAPTLAAAQPAPGQEPPRFRVGVDIVPIDVTVVDGDGRPVTDLAPSDFTVLVNGTSRRVVTADWISFAGGAARAEAPGVEGYSTNEQAIDGRLIVLAIDQGNIRFGGGRTIKESIDRFLDHLSSSDRVALVGLGRGAQSIPFTADRDRIKQAVARMNGQLRLPATSPMFNLSLSLESAFGITRGDTLLLETFIKNCTAGGRDGPDTCALEIGRLAADAVHNATQPRDDTIRALKDVLTTLRGIDAPKSLVLVSEGLAIFDGDENTRAELLNLGSLAASARTSLYALRLDDRIFDAGSGSRPISPPSADVRIRADGLETLASAARGALFTVTGTGAAAFARIESELSGYYLLGVEAPPDIAAGQSSPLRVQVARSGVTIRARTRFTAPAAEPDAPARSPQMAAAAALTTPLMMSGLPLRVISFNFQGPDPSNVQLLIHADVGQSYNAAQSVGVAYIIADGDGRIVEGQATSGRLQPGSAGVPSPLAFSAGAALPPGDYLLKLAAAEGNRVGSVEHPIRVSLNDVGALRLSDLTVGGPVQAAAAPLRPSVGYTVHFGVVHGYLEAYGAGAGSASVKFEVARDEQSPVLVSEVVAARPVNESRALFSRMVPIGALPPGQYQLRATVDAGGAPVGTLSRAFEIAGPAAATADAPGSDAVLRSATELFLPIDPEDLRIPFQAADALRAEVLAPFAARVPAAARDDFEAGIGHLRTGDYSPAETAFKRAIRPGLDFTAAVTYLAVAFAASGHDAEAASAWQTALVGGSSMPQIYTWLGDALLRIREFARARAALEEALRRWPADTRFARPLAVLNATTGRGYDAIQRLQQYLAANADDSGALYLGVQWIYQVHLSGATIRDRDADVALARTYADAYRRVNGPKQPLVAQWLDYLTKSAR